MRTAIVIGGLAIAGYGLLRASWEPDHFTEFLVNVHADSSANWTMIIPLSTWNAMKKDIDEREFRISTLRDSGLSSVSRELIEQIARGFNQYKLSADRCRVTSTEPGDSKDTVRIDGRCVRTYASLGRGNQV